jgi:membrane fusion protein, multidrug efflux system
LIFDLFLFSMPAKFSLLTKIALSVGAAAALGGAYYAGRSTVTASGPATSSTLSSPAAPAGAANAPKAAPGGTAAANAGPPPTTVEVAKVVKMALPQSITAVGSLRSDETVILRPEVSGRIAEILFQEGQAVTKGAPLVRFDSTVQRAELEQARATLALNKSKFDRAVDLQKTGFISSQARDEADNNFKVARANADVAEAKMAKLELRAPFSGLTGLRSASVGDYVREGQEIVNLEAVNTLKADFRVPENLVGQVKTGQSLQIALDAFPNQTFAGKIYAINPQLDQAGRAILIRASVANPNAKLRPGMFARVRILLSANADALVVPEQTLIPVGDDQYLFKVVDGRALRVKVDIGQRADTNVEIIRGVSATDVVITAGQLKVRDGGAVKVAGAEKPAAAPAKK